MGWHQRSLLTLDREIGSATHARWCERNFTPEYRANLDHNRRVHERAAELAGFTVREADSRWREYDAALRRAEAELGPEPFEGFNESQCGGCKWWCPLDGGYVGSDWGACFCAESPWDGTLKFEHDSCPHVAPDDAPATPELVEFLTVGVGCAKTELREAKRALRRGE